VEDAPISSGTTSLGLHPASSPPTTPTICSSSGVTAAIVLAHSSNPRTRRSAALQIAALFDAQLPNVAMLPGALPRAPDLVEMPNSASSYSTAVRLPPDGVACVPCTPLDPLPGGSESGKKKLLAAFGRALLG
jgi:hypothetical protein